MDQPVTRLARTSFRSAARWASWDPPDQHPVAPLGGRGLHGTRGGAGPRQGPAHARRDGRRAAAGRTARRSHRGGPHPLPHRGHLRADGRPCRRPAGHAHLDAADPVLRAPAPVSERAKDEMGAYFRKLIGAGTTAGTRTSPRCWAPPWAGTDRYGGGRRTRRPPPDRRRGGHEEQQRADVLPAHDPPGAGRPAALRPSDPRQAIDELLRYIPHRNMVGLSRIARRTSRSGAYGSGPAIRSTSRTWPPTATRRSSRTRSTSTSSAAPIRTWRSASARTFARAGCWPGWSRNSWSTRW